MSERHQEGTRRPNAGQILAFHVDHERGLHTTYVTNCSLPIGPCGRRF